MSRRRGESESVGWSGWAGTYCWDWHWTEGRETGSAVDREDREREHDSVEVVIKTTAHDASRRRSDRPCAAGGEDSCCTASPDTFGRFRKGCSRCEEAAATWTISSDHW